MNINPNISAHTLQLFGIATPTSETTAKALFNVPTSVASAAVKIDISDRTQVAGPYDELLPKAREIREKTDRLSAEMDAIVAARAEEPFRRFVTSGSWGTLAAARSRSTGMASFSSHEDASRSALNKLGDLRRTITHQQRAEEAIASFSKKFPADLKPYAIEKREDRLLSNSIQEEVAGHELRRSFGYSGETSHRLADGTLGFTGFEVRHEAYGLVAKMFDDGMTAGYAQDGSINYLVSGHVGRVQGDPLSYVGVIHGTEAQAFYDEHFG